MNKSKKNLLEEERYPSDAIIQAANAAEALTKLPVDNKLCVEKICKISTPMSAALVDDSITAIFRRYITAEDKIEKSFLPRAADMNAPRAAVGMPYFPESADDYVMGKMSRSTCPRAAGVFEPLAVSCITGYPETPNDYIRGLAEKATCPRAADSSIVKRKY